MSTPSNSKSLFCSKHQFALSINSVNCNDFIPQDSARLHFSLSISIPITLQPLFLRI